MSINALQSIYSEPKNILGSKKLLFNLLVDEDPEEAWEDVSKSYLTRAEVMESIIGEISKILNTRLTAKNADYENLKDDPLNFGIPSLFGFTDFHSFDSTSPNQWWRISKLCENAITAFETRLTNVRVTIEGLDPHRQALNITIKGYIFLYKIREEVRFPLALECGNAR